MALDPSIGLGFKPTTPFDPMGAASQGMKLAQMGQQIEQSKQEIEASKASQAYTEAQTPGAAADSEQKQRGLRYITWEQQNKHKFVKPDGSIDTNEYVNEAAKNGFGDYAGKVATSDLARTADQIKNATNQQEQGIKVQEFRDKTAGHAATLLAATPEKDRPAMLRKIMDGTEALMPGSGKYVFGLFGNQDDTGVVTVDAGKMDAVRTATMTPQQQKEKELAERGVAVSERSQTLAETTASPEYKKQVEDITPGGSKVEGLKNAAVRDQYVAKLSNGIAAIDDKGLNEFMGRPGATVAQVWNTYVSQNPAARQLQASIDEYNRQNKDANLSIRDGLPAIRRVLSGEAQTARNVSKTDRALASKGTVSEAAAENQPQEVGEPTKTVPQTKASGKVVTMVKPGVKESYRIPEEQVERALKGGWVKVSK